MPVEFWNRTRWERRRSHVNHEDSKAEGIPLQFSHDTGVCHCRRASVAGSRRGLAGGARSLGRWSSEGSKRRQIRRRVRGFCGSGGDRGTSIQAVTQAIAPPPPTDGRAHGHDAGRGTATLLGRERSRQIRRNRDDGVSMVHRSHQGALNRYMAQPRQSTQRLQLAWAIFHPMSTRNPAANRLCHIS